MKKNIHHDSSKILYLILFIGIIIIASYLRFSGVITNSFAFTYDVGRDMLQVNSIVHTHKLPLIGETSGIAGLFYGPWWYYLLIIPFLLARGDPQGIDFFMALLSIISITIAYGIGKRMGNNFFAVIFSGLLAVSAAVIGSTNQIWNPDIIPFFLVLSIYFFSKLLKNNTLSKIEWLFLGVIFGFLIQGEIVFGVLFTISACITLIILLRKKLITVNILFAILGVIIIFSPQLFFEFRHQFIEIKFLLNLPKQSVNQNIFTIFTAQVSSFFRLFLDSVAGGYPLLGLVELIGVLVTFFFVIKRHLVQANKMLLFSSVLLSVFFITTIFVAHAVWGYYLIGLPVFFVMLVSLSLSVWFHEKRFQYFVIVIAIGLFLANLHPIQVISQIGKPPFTGDAAVYRNQVAVIDYIYKRANRKRFNYTTYTPVVYDYTYQFLFSWYGKKQYGYIPSTKKESLFFLIIEPNFQFPDLVQQWLDVRKNDGKIIESVKMKSGIVVQTRIH